MNRAWLAALGLLACSKASPPAHAPVPTAPTPTAAEADEPARPQPNPAGTWHIVALQVEVEVEPDQRLPGLDDAKLTASLQPFVQKMLQVKGFGPPPADVPRGQRVGVALMVAWQRVDDAGRPVPVGAPPADGQMVLTLAAHAEQMPGKGEPAIARRTLQITVPLPAERAGDLPAFLTARLAQAAEAAIADALGELWARGLADAAVRALLDDEVTWRRVAAAREVGERKLLDMREKLEKLARDSRKDVATVALAALGRLGDAQSLPVLVAATDSGHPEVVDAALGALLDLGTAEARAALRKIAEQHESPAVRRRAEELLRGR